MQKSRRWQVWFRFGVETAISSEVFNWSVAWFVKMPGRVVFLGGGGGRGGVGCTMASL